jgi:hypothetical protein
MKYLNYFNIFENKEAIDKLLKNTDSEIDPTDVDYFRRETQKSKTPNNLYRIIKWLSNGEEASEVSVVYDYYLELRDKNLKVPDINQFEESEDLYDALQKIENQYYVNKMVQEMPSHLKSQYKRLSGEDKLEFDALLYELNNKENKIEIIKKLSRYKYIDKLKEVLINFTNGTDDYETKLLELELDDGINIVYTNSDKKIIVVTVDKYESCSKHGPSSWCIVTSESMFNSYTSGNTQYIIFDYNLKNNSRYSIVGVTVINNILKVISNGGDSISTAHDRFDDYLSPSDVEKLIKKKSIPKNIIFKDFNEENEDVKKALIRTNIDNTINFVRIYPKYKQFLIDYYKKHGNLIELLKIRKRLGNVNEEETLNRIETLYQEVWGREFIIEAYAISKEPIVVEYIDKIILNYLNEYSEKLVEMLYNLSTQQINRFINVVKQNDDDEAKFKFLKTYQIESNKRNLKYTRLSSETLKELSLKYETFKDPYNRFYAKLLFGKSKAFEASEELKDFNEVEQYSIRKLLSYKIGGENKQKILSNIINFYGKLTDQHQRKVLDDIMLSVKYIGVNNWKKILDLTKETLLKESIVKKLLSIEPKIGNVVGFHYVKNEPYSLLNLKELIIEATPKQIKDNLDLLEKICFTKIVTEYVVINNYQMEIIIHSGNTDLINKSFDSLIYIISSSTQNIADIFISKKLKLEDFKRLIQPFLNGNYINNSSLTYYAAFIKGDIEKFKYIIDYLDIDNLWNLIYDLSLNFQNEGILDKFKMCIDKYNKKLNSIKKSSLIKRIEKTYKDSSYHPKKQILYDMIDILNELS